MKERPQAVRQAPEREGEEDALERHPGADAEQPAGAVIAAVPAPGAEEHRDERRGDDDLVEAERLEGGAHPGVGAVAQHLWLRPAEPQHPALVGEEQRQENDQDGPRVARRGEVDGRIHHPKCDTHRSKKPGNDVAESGELGMKESILRVSRDAKALGLRVPCLWLCTGMLEPCLCKATGMAPNHDFQANSGYLRPRSWRRCGVGRVRTMERPSHSARSRWRGAGRSLPSASASRATTGRAGVCNSRGAMCDATTRPTEPSASSTTEPTG